MYQTKMFFETIKIQDEVVCNIFYHNKRMNKTRVDIFGAKTNIDLQKHISTTLRGVVKCRVLYRENIISISYLPYIQKNIYSLTCVYDDNINYEYKKNDRKEIDNLLELRDDGDEIIIIKNDLLSDTSIANIAILHNDIWITPKTPLLYGTMRESMIDKGLLVTRDIDIEQLQCAKKICLLNSMIGAYVLDDFMIIDK